MRTHRIAVLAGDCIGKEVIPSGLEFLNASDARNCCALEFTQFPITTLAECFAHKRLKRK